MSPLLGHLFSGVLMVKNNHNSFQRQIATMMMIIILIIPIVPSKFKMLHKAPSLQTFWKALKTDIYRQAFLD